MGTAMTHRRCRRDGPASSRADRSSRAKRHRPSEKHLRDQQATNDRVYRNDPCRARVCAGAGRLRNLTSPGRTPFGAAIAPAAREPGVVRTVSMTSSISRAAQERDYSAHGRGRQERPHAQPLREPPPMSTSAGERRGSKQHFHLARPKRTTDLVIGICDRDASCSKQVRLRLLQLCEVLARQLILTTRSCPRTP